MIFKAEVRLRAYKGGMGRVPAPVQRKEHAHLCGLAALLQQLDAVPGLETLQKMGVFYTKKGIDILKDIVVCIPGVSLHYLLRGAIERGADFYSFCTEAYEMNE